MALVRVVAGNGSVHTTAEIVQNINWMVSQYDAYGPAKDANNSIACQVSYC